MVIVVGAGATVHAQSDDRFALRFASRSQIDPRELSWSEFKLSDSILSFSEVGASAILIDLKACSNLTTQNLVRDFHSAHQRGLTHKKTDFKFMGGTIVDELVQGKQIEKVYDAGSKYAQFLNRLRFEMTSLQSAIRRGCSPAKAGGK